MTKKLIALLAIALAGIMGLESCSYTTDTQSERKAPIKHVNDPMPSIPKPKPKAKPQAKDAVQPEAPAAHAPTVSFGTYSGPDDGIGGTIHVTQSYALDLRNASHQTIQLEPGDVITRTVFKNGELVSGRWERADQSQVFTR